jgi:outer membrane protein assembly factor BamB
LLFLVGLPALASDWPQFLGPNRDGVVRDKGLNLDWKAKKPATLWKVPVGNAFSSVIIVDNKIYTQAKRGENDSVVCLDAKDGKEFWHFDVAPTYLDKQRHGYGPRSTPTHHEGKLYCLFPMGELVCMTVEGKKVWQANIFKDTGAKNHAGETYYWGVSMSPLALGDLVIVQPGGTDGNSVAAYHKDTGKLVWTVASDPMGYASPIAVTIAGKKQLVVPTGQSILGIDPVKGEVLWRHVFGNQFNATAASPIWAELPRSQAQVGNERTHVLFVSAAYGAGSAALEILPPDKDRKIWTVREKWKQKKMQTLMATSVILDGHIYGFSGDLAGFTMRCVSLADGEIKWEERMPARQGLLALDGHLVCVGERGDVQLIEAQPRSFSVKGALPKVLAYKAWSAPAFADGKLYLRDERHLVCLDLRK